MGIWVNRQTEQSNQYATDFTGGYQFGASGNQLWFNSYNTYQPYVEYTWRPTKNLEITPGVKYDMINEDQLAAYSGAGTVTGYGSATYHALLPSLDIHYYLQKNWTIYAQAAEGFLPPLAKQAFRANNVFGVNANLNPQNTKNLQLGTVYKANRYSISADTYFINNNNLTQSAGIGPGGYTLYTNAGNTNFSGLDTEATYKVGYGYSLYGNFSYERTQSAASSPIYNAPVTTSALGVLYDKNNFNANIIAKEVGSRIGGQWGSNNSNYTLASYTLVNLAAGYKFTHIYGYAHDTEIQLQANNITNRFDPVWFNGATAVNSNPLLYTLFGRTFNVNLTTTF